VRNVFVQEARKDRWLTHNSAPHVLCVPNCFELETVFEARDAMCVCTGTTSNDQFIVTEKDAKSWFPINKHVLQAHGR